MAIVKLTPSCKDYLWGGSRLRTDFGVQSSLDPLAEAWVLSCHPDGPSYLPDGSTLADYVAAHPGCLGTDCEKFEQFPILTKFIDAKNNLSIQVHPSNEYALKNEHQYGKTEMWYVLDCEPGAFLYYGFDHEVSKEEFAERIKNNTLTEVLNAAPVHKGDCFFIPSGTLHAICKGIVVAEVQQNSNVTYRVYDYGRVGADGKPRALHVEKALDVTLRTPPVKHDFGGHLARCEYFTVDAKNGDFDGVAGEKSFVSLLITDGAACDTVYTVEITPLDNAPAPAQTSVQVKGGGTAYFTGLTFDAPGDYRYKLSQVKGCAVDTTYDGRTYTVTVRVMTAADGSLDTELWAVRSGRTAKAAGVVFTNRYNPPVPAATATPAPSAAPMPRPAKNTARPVGALPRTGDAFPLEALAALLCAGVVGFGTAWNKRR